MRRWVAIALLSCACGAPERIPFGDDVAWYAAVQVDGETVTGATGLLPFDRSASVYFADDAIAIGWTAEAIAAMNPPAAEALATDTLRAASGCQPRLPSPAVAVRLPDGTAVDAPPLTATWMEAACPDVDPLDVSFDLECKLFRCPLTTISRTQCRFEFDLDCEFGRMNGTLWPDGSMCLEPIAPVACEAVEPIPPRAATYTCRAPEMCVVHAYTERELDLEVETIRFLDVEPYSPPPDLIGQLVLPPVASRFFGYAHDFAISGDDLALSVGPGTPFRGCGEAVRGVIEIYDVDTLTRTASAAVPGCVQRLAPTADGFLGMESLNGRFELTRFDRRGRVVNRVTADARFNPGPEEAPLLFTQDARVSYFDVVGDAVVTAVVTTGGTKVFTWDLATLAPAHRTWHPEVTIVHGTSVDTTTVILADTERPRVHWFDLDAGVVRDVVQFPPQIDREDHRTSDVSWTGELALFTLSRKNAGVYPITETQVLERSVIFDDDARPMATLRWPGTTRALVAGTWSTDQVNWPASLAEYDLETQRFVPGSVPTGHGAPGRMIADDVGRIWVLLPWDAKLLRVGR